MGFGSFLKKAGGAVGAPWAGMDNAQRLGALGGILSGDMSGLGLIMQQLDGGKGQPVRNEDGQDIAAAFGGALGPEPVQRGPVKNSQGEDISAAFGSGQRSKRKFGFGRG
jgi:hypothetical protein